MATRVWELVGSLLRRPPDMHTLALTIVAVFTTTLVLVAADAYRPRLARHRAR